MELWITEKPSLAEAIAAVLPGAPVKHRTHYVVGQINVAWLIGHAYEQAMPEDYDPRYAKWDAGDLPIVPKKWALKPKDGSAAQLKAIASLHAQATRIIHAGDPDAEGQLLVQEVLDELRNKKPVFRVLVNDYNETKVREAIRAMRPNTDAQYVGWHQWAECRGRLDYLFGLNLTRAYTLRGRALGYDGVLTVGRVQTPTLAIVVARDETIEGFKATPFYRLVAQFAHDGTEFFASWNPKANQAGLDTEGRLVDSRVAQHLVAELLGKQATVASFADTAKNQDVPLPFDLTTLQMAANARFGYSAKAVLDAAQELYEKYKVTTYPRTDCRYLSLAQHAETVGRLRAVAKSMPALASLIARADPSRRSATFDDSKVNGPHHGIVPTHQAADLAALSQTERDVYELIVRVYVAQFLPPYQYRDLKVVIDIAGEAFGATGRVPTAPGWKEAFGDSEDDQDEDGDVAARVVQKLPTMVEGQRIACLGVSAEPSKTTAPKRFTERLLLGAMENIQPYVSDPAARARLKKSKGIGTPATRAGIIEELKRRHFLALKGTQLTSTPAARALIHALPRVATDPGFTGLTELTLDLVASGKVTPEAFLGRTADLVRALTDEASKAPMSMPMAPVIPCPKCREGKLRLRQRSDKKGRFWGCDRFKEGCTAAYDDKRGKPDFTGKSSRPAAKTAKRAPTKRAPRKGAGGAAK